MIKGIHHVSMKCENREEFDRAMSFYIDVLGLKIRRQWADGAMIDAGNALLEIFASGGSEKSPGLIKHFALVTDNVDETVEKVRAAGYEILIEPNDRVIKSSPEFPFRMAFCRGPLGEEVEFFYER